MENFKALKGDLVELELTKDQRFGLGIALSGHKERHRMGTFVCGVHPEGPASKAKNQLKHGDELLKVRVILDFLFEAWKDGKMLSMMQIS